jgi:hypothetical protein
VTSPTSVLTGGSSGRLTPRERDTPRRGRLGDEEARAGQTTDFKVTSGEGHQEDRRGPAVLTVACGRGKFSKQQDCKEIATRTRRCASMHTGSTRNGMHAPPTAGWAANGPS